MARVRARRAPFYLLQGVIALALLAPLGCASGKTSSAASISAADYAIQKTAEDRLDQRSEVILLQARDKLERARKLRDDGEHEAAERLADEAAMEAQLADATAMNTAVHSVATELEQLVEALREESRRGSRP